MQRSVKLKDEQSRTVYDMSKSENKVLIITYYWPPASGPGVQRFLKFCKYLPEFGWQPYVITVENGTYSATDTSLTTDVPDGVTVKKTKTAEPFTAYNKITGKKNNEATVGMINMKGKQSLIKQAAVYIRANYFIPDARKGWNKYAFEEAKKLIEQENIDTVITTGPPQSTHLIGLKLKKKLKIKWVADFRDPWTTVYYNEMLPRTMITQRKDKKYEDSVLKNADKIVVVSHGLKEEFAERNKNIEVIYNGYDENDMLYTPWGDKNKKFTIASIGNFKPNQDITKLWQAISEICQENAEFAQATKIELTGNVDQNIIDGFHTFNIQHLLKVNKYVPHLEATKLMITADVLLFIIPQTDRNHLIITGKIFEYLASGTPLFAIGPTQGNASKIIDSVNRERMIDYDDIESMKSNLITLFENWKNTEKPIRYSTNDIVKYSRKGLSEKLAKLLHSMH